MNIQIEKEKCPNRAVEKRAKECADYLHIGLSDWLIILDYLHIGLSDVYL